MISIRTGKKPRVDKDFYATPGHITRAFLRHYALPDGEIWEPACGNGLMVREQEAAGRRVKATDLVDRGFGTGRVDFLLSFLDKTDIVMTNPPFALALQFLKRALEVARKAVIFLLPSRYINNITWLPYFRLPAFVGHITIVGKIAFWNNGIEPPPDTRGMQDCSWYIWRKDQPRADGQLPFSDFIEQQPGLA